MRGASASRGLNHQQGTLSVLSGRYELSALLFALAPVARTITGRLAGRADANSRERRRMQKGSAFSVEMAKWPQCSQQTNSPSRPVSLPRYYQSQRCAICGEPSVSAASDTGKAGRPLDPTPARRKIPRAPHEAARCVPGGAQGRPRPRRHAAGRELLGRFRLI